MQFHTDIGMTSQPIFIAPNNPDFVANRVHNYFSNRVNRSWGGGHIMHGKHPKADDIVLTSNDYLCLVRHPNVVKAMIDTLSRGERVEVASSVYLHGDCPLTRLESRLANFMQAQGGVICQSGYAANVGLIQSIAKQNTPIYIDICSHMSFWEGIRSAGAKGVPFRNNDLQSLAHCIERNGPGIIAVDSIYSVSGAIAPLRDLASLSEKFNCVLVVDESHSLGTHGPQGAGLTVELGLSHRIHFRTASLSKAFACRAGFLACSDEFSQYFKYESHPAIFSSGLAPQDISALNTTLTIVQREPWRRELLRRNSEYLRNGLNALGYNLNGSASQIISLESGSEQNTIKLRDELNTRGLFGSPFCAPATPQNRALIRFSINASLTTKELHRIIDICADIRDVVQFEQWPSTRRLDRACV